MKSFIITVDTEGDNLWRYKKGDNIGIQNSKYIPRFQKLCEKYGFKPVYLTNYEMANSEIFVNNAKEWLRKGSCEIGVHLHAWNNPPIFNLDGVFNGNPYLIEYPEEIMKSKFKEVYDLIVKNFEIKPISHRAGRWIMDERYFKILEDFSIKVDCSYTPGIDWSKTMGRTRGGCDYSDKQRNAHFIGNVLEVPATIRRFHDCSFGSWKHRLKTLIKGDNFWLRPATSSFNVMKKIIDQVDYERNEDFLEFMIHSSELMPDGSPYFATNESIEHEYNVMEQVFAYVKSNGYKGCTLEEYYINRTHKLNM